MKRTRVYAWRTREEYNAHHPPYVDGPFRSRAEALKFSVRWYRDNGYAVVKTENA